jgi:hypothetical protein
MRDRGAMTGGFGRLHEAGLLGRALVELAGSLERVDAIEASLERLHHRSRVGIGG